MVALPRRILKAYTMILIFTVITSVIAIMDFTVKNYAFASEYVHNILYSALYELQKNNFIDAAYIKNSQAIFYEGPLTLSNYESADKISEIMNNPVAKKEQFILALGILNENRDEKRYDNVNLEGDYCSMKIYLSLNKESEDCFKILQKRFPTNESVQIGFILSLNNVGKYSEALEFIRIKNLENNLDPKMQNIIAIIKANSATPANSEPLYDSVAIYQNLISKYPEEKYLYSGLGWVEMKLKLYDQCIKTLEHGQSIQTVQTNHWIETNLELCKNLSKGDPYTKLQELLVT